MKKKLIFAAGLSLAFLATSCSMNEDAIVPKNEGFGTTDGIVYTNSPVPPPPPSTNPTKKSE